MSTKTERFLVMAATLAALSLPATARAQTLPRTVAERTDYHKTGTTADVEAFLDSLQLAGAPITVGRMGQTAEGRPILFVIASDPRVTSAAEAKRSGKLVVYLQANIHAGEVEGKEAVQQLLREMIGPRRDLLTKLVVLVAPVYNADGNDAMGPVARNRPEQNGPDSVGVRPDGLNLDLNRDYLKAEAPETRASLARVYDTWDPAVMMDLHTTDGTRHGYLLTYSPPLNPNGPPAPTQFAQDDLLPAVRAAMQRKYGEPVFPYGNVRNPMDPKAWTTYSPLAWYGTNYVGMRGRIAILSEAYAHADFRTRVKVTHDFVLEVLEYAAAHADEIRQVEAQADRETALEGAGAASRPDLAVAYQPVSRGVEPVVLREVKAVAPPAGSPRRRPRYEPTGKLDTVKLPIMDRFAATATETLPGGYFLPRAEGGIAKRLRLHGIQVQRLKAQWTGTAQVFRIDSLSWQANEFQGHHLLSVAGHYENADVTLPAGSYYVSTAQPLGRLVFELLEPEGYGLPRWNFFDRRLGSEAGGFGGTPYGSSARRTFPLWRVDRDPDVAMRRLP
ncbi:MAG: M14 family metallopeptidase [Gemmatimonadota bacterium]